VLLLRLLALPDLFEQEVLKRLEPVDRTMVAQVGRPWLAAVLASGLPRLPKRPRVCLLRLREFCTSVERLAWARANGCPWNSVVYYDAILGGHLAALQWLREQGCPFGDGSVVKVSDYQLSEDIIFNVIRDCCALAARCGQLEVLRWAREQNWPWSVSTCSMAAEGGHLELLQWAREHGCP